MKSPRNSRHDSGSRPTTHAPGEAHMLVHSLGVIDPVATNYVLNTVRHACSELAIGVACHAFGSVGAGLSTKHSDLDVTIETCSPVSKQEANSALRKLVPVLVQDGFQILQKIETSRVPVIKLLAPNGTEVDISYNNMNAVTNTHLVRSYVSFEPVVIGGLIRLIKEWARTKRVSGAQIGHLSSYAWTLAVLYFLQVSFGLPSVRKLPELKRWNESHGNAFRRSLPSLDDLVWRFFQFYAETFHWGGEVASVRVGRRVYWGSVELLDTYRPWFRSVIDIEDPYDFTPCAKRRNLSVVLQNETSIDKIYTAIWVAAHADTISELLVEDAPGLRCELCGIHMRSVGKWCKFCWNLARMRSRSLSSLDPAPAKREMENEAEISTVGIGPEPGISASSSAEHGISVYVDTEYSSDADSPRSSPGKADSNEKGSRRVLLPPPPTYAPPVPPHMHLPPMPSTPPHRQLPSLPTTPPSTSYMAKQLPMSATVGLDGKHMFKGSDLIYGSECSWQDAEPNACQEHVGCYGDNRSVSSTVPDKPSCSVRQAEKSYENWWEDKTGVYDSWWGGSWQEDGNADKRDSWWLKYGWDSQSDRFEHGKVLANPAEKSDENGAKSASTWNTQAKSASTWNTQAPNEKYGSYRASPANEKYRMTWNRGLRYYDKSDATAQSESVRDKSSGKNARNVPTRKPTKTPDDLWYECLDVANHKSVNVRPYLCPPVSKSKPSPYQHLEKRRTDDQNLPDKPRSTGGKRKAKPELRKFLATTLYNGVEKNFVGEREDGYLPLVPGDVVIADSDVIENAQPHNKYAFFSLPNRNAKISQGM